MGNPNKDRGYRFEKAVYELWEEAGIPCVRPHGSSGASLRAVGLTPTSDGDVYDDDCDNITDFQTETEAVWQLKAWGAFPEYIYDAPYDQHGGLLVYDSEEHADYVFLRWPAFLSWHRDWRQYKQERCPDGVMPRLQSLVCDRVFHELKPQPGRLGRIVRRPRRQVPFAKTVVAILREHDFYQPYGLAD